MQMMQCIDEMKKNCSGLSEAESNAEWNYVYFCSHPIYPVARKDDCKDFQQQKSYWQIA